MTIFNIKEKSEMLNQNEISQTAVEWPQALAGKTIGVGL